MKREITRVTVVEESAAQERKLGFFSDSMMQKWLANPEVSKRVRQYNIAFGMPLDVAERLAVGYHRGLYTLAEVLYWLGHKVEARAQSIERTWA